MLTLPSSRLTLALAALAAAACSQAVMLNYAGNGPLNSATTTTLGLVDDFNFAKSITVGNVLTLSDASNANGLRLTAIGLAPSALYSGYASATGFGSYAGYSASSIGVTITTNNTTSYSVSAQGTINPVPEPASFAALGLGSLALLRRRKRA